MALSVVESDEPTRLGVWLKEQMAERGLSVRQVSELSGGRVSKSVISALTTGRHRGSRLNPESVQGIADVFGISPEDVFGMIDHREPGEPYIPPPEARWMTKEMRRVVDEVIRAFFYET